jgi:hypothetical protein
LVAATSSEPDDAPGVGDGATTGDVVVLDVNTVQLRAEWDATRAGRTYTLRYRATDRAGNTTERTVTVDVPRGAD